MVVIALAIGVFIGFGIPRKGQPSDSGLGGAVKRNWTKSSKEVAYILPNEGPYYDLKWYGVSTELEKLGYTAQKYTAGAYKNVKAQTDIMENLIQKKVGAIILHSVESINSWFQSGHRGHDLFDAKSWLAGCAQWYVLSGANTQLQSYDAPMDPGTLLPEEASALWERFNSQGKWNIVHVLKFGFPCIPESGA